MRVHVVLVVVVTVFRVFVLVLFLALPLFTLAASTIEGVQWVQGHTRLLPLAMLYNIRGTACLHMRPNLHVHFPSGAKPQGVPVRCAVVIIACMYGVPKSSLQWWYVSPPGTLPTTSPLVFFFFSAERGMWHTEHPANTARNMEDRPWMDWESLPPHHAPVILATRCFIFRP